nr:PREDICTED: transcription factor TFIIIB component B'' homolog [Latimeria chalumnae]|eukprot:XP_014352341.1 PREDICTED: transcription factor TFIIIB component B'' homolog [Latimeria chalumnae]
MFRRARISVKPNVKPGGRGGQTSSQELKPVEEALSSQNTSEKQVVGSKDVGREASASGSSFSASSTPAPGKPAPIEAQGEQQEALSQNEEKNVGEAHGSSKPSLPAFQRRKRISTVPNLAKPRSQPPSMQRPSPEMPKSPQRQLPPSSASSTALVQNDFPPLENALPKCSPSSPRSRNLNVGQQSRLPEKKTPIPHVPQFSPVKKPPEQDLTTSASLNKADEVQQKVASLPLKERSRQESTSPDDKKSVLELSSAPKKRISTERQRIMKAQKLRQLLREEIKREKRHWRESHPVFETKAPVERSKMTMRDFIYYLPENNPMTASLEEERTQTAKPLGPVAVKEPEEKKAPDSENEEEDEEAEAASNNESFLVPRVKVAEDGTIILDEESLTVEVLRTKGPAVVENNDPIFERGSTTTYSSFRKSTYTKPWSNKETDMFFLAISMVGTDFSMIGQLFPHRQRTEIKNKFKREEKNNGWRIDKAFREKTPFDFQFFGKLLEKILAEEARKKEKNARNQSTGEKKRAARTKKPKDKKAVARASENEPAGPEQTEFSDAEGAEADPGTAEKENEDSRNVLDQEHGQTSTKPTPASKKRKRKKKDGGSGETEVEKVSEDNSVHQNSCTKKSRKKKNVPAKPALEADEDASQTVECSEESRATEEGVTGVDVLPVEKPRAKRRKKPIQDSSPGNEENVTPSTLEEPTEKEAPEPSNNTQKSRLQKPKPNIKVRARKGGKATAEREDVSEDSCNVEPGDPSKSNEDDHITRSHSSEAGSHTEENATLCTSEGPPEKEFPELSSKPSKARFQKPKPNLKVQARRQGRASAEQKKVLEDGSEVEQAEPGKQDSDGCASEHHDGGADSHVEEGEEPANKEPPGSLRPSRFQKPKPNIKVQTKRGGKASAEQKNTPEDINVVEESDQNTDNCEDELHMEEAIVPSSSVESAERKSFEPSSKSRQSCFQKAKPNAEVLSRKSRKGSDEDSDLSKDDSAVGTSSQEKPTADVSATGIHDYETESLPNENTVCNKPTSPERGPLQDPEPTSEETPSEEDPLPPQDHALEKNSTLPPQCSEGGTASSLTEDLGRIDATDVHTTPEGAGEAIEGKALEPDAESQSSGSLGTEQAAVKPTGLLMGRFRRPKPNLLQRVERKKCASEAESNVLESEETKEGSQQAGIPDNALSQITSDQEGVSPSTSEVLKGKEALEPSSKPCRSRFQKPKPNIKVQARRGGKGSDEENRTLKSVSDDGTSDSQKQIADDSVTESPVQGAATSQSAASSPLEEPAEKETPEPVSKSRWCRFQKPKPNIGVQARRSGKESEEKPTVKGDGGDRIPDSNKSAAEPSATGSHECEVSSQYNENIIYSKPANLTKDPLEIPELHTEKVSDAKPVPPPDKAIEKSKTSSVKPAEVEMAPRSTEILQENDSSVTKSIPKKAEESAEGASVEPEAESQSSEKEVVGEESRHPTVKPAGLARGRFQKPKPNLKRVERKRRAPAAENDAAENTESKKALASVEEAEEGSQLVSAKERSRPTRLGRQTGIPAHLKAATEQKYLQSASSSSSECESESRARCRPPRAQKPKGKVAKGKGQRDARSKSSRKEQGSAKTALVTLRASQNEEEDDDEDDDDNDEPGMEYDDDDGYPLNPEEVNKAPVFVPVGLRSPNPPPVQIEETMEELEISVNVLDAHSVVESEQLFQESGESNEPEERIELSQEQDKESAEAVESASTSLGPPCIIVQEQTVEQPAVDDEQSSILPETTPSISEPAHTEHVGREHSEEPSAKTELESEREDESAASTAKGGEGSRSVRRRPLKPKPNLGKIAGVGRGRQQKAPCLVSPAQQSGEKFEGKGERCSAFFFFFQPVLVPLQ